MTQAFDGIPAPGAAVLTLWRPALGGRALAIAGTVILVATAAALIALDTSDDTPYTAAVVESPDYWLGGLLAGGMLGACAALWFAPSAGAWSGALVLLVTAAGERPGSEAFLVSGAGALLLSTLWLAVVVGRRRQAVAARSWATAPVRVPDAEPGARRYAQRWRGLWTLAGAALVGAALAGTGMFAHEHRAAQAFRAQALEDTGTVVDVADDDMSAVVQVDGLHLDVPLPSVYVEVGEEVVVRYDGSGRAELVDDVADPSLWLFLSGAGVVGGAALLAQEAARRRGVATLLTHGGPAVRVLATWDGKGGATFAPVDAPGEPFGRAGDLLGLAALPEPEESDRLVDPFSQAVEEVSDDELLDLARRMAAEAIDGDPSAEPEGVAVPSTWASTGVLVVGLLDDRSPIAVQAPDGTWYATETTVRPGHGRRHGVTTRHAGAAPSGAARAGTAPGGTVASEDVDRGGDGRGRLGRLARRSGTVGPWLALPVVAAFVWWLGPELVTWWSVVFFAFGTASVLHAWAWAATPALGVTARALVARRPVLDEHLPWARVRDVVADESALVIRTYASSTEEADALMYSVPPGEQLLPGTGDAREARDRLLAARALGLGLATADTSTRRLPSRAAVVAALGALACVAGLVAGS